MVARFSKKEKKGMKLNNIFSGIPHFMPDEVSETLLKTEAIELERIVSSGQGTPEGEWYDQDTDEWVILLSGSAGLFFEDEEEVFIMNAGDYVHIEPHRRHRVEWTDPGQKTVWLALHFSTVSYEGGRGGGVS
jgi:cupin 2 domain-containing protein